MNKFKRLPSRVEKEPMRNLYMYYKRLKQYITRKAAQPDGGQGALPTPSTRVSSNASRGTTGSAMSNLSQPSGGSVISGSSAFGSTPVPEQEKTPNAGNGPKNELTSIELGEEVKGPKSSDIGDKKDLNIQEKSEMDEFKRKYNIQTHAQAQKRLQEIKTERKDLRQKLDQFQRDFEAVHNRKIRYTKDIVKVQVEFKRYKDLKIDVANIEKLQKLLQR